MESKSKTALGILALLAVTAIVIVALARSPYPPMMNQFSVTAQGRVFAKPDIANIRLGTKTEAKPTAAQAVDENSKKMNDVIGKFKAMGIEAKDIKTVSYNLNPEYDYNVYPASLNGQATITPVPPQGPRLIGYSLYQEILVQIRNLDTLGAVIEGASSAGANQIGGISFTIDDPENLKAEARSEAIEKAKQKAHATASLAGLKLERLVNVYENEGPLPYQPMMANYGMGGDAMLMKESAPDIQAGQNEIIVSVTLSYEVDD